MNNRENFTQRQLKSLAYLLSLNFEGKIIDVNMFDEICGELTKHEKEEVLREFVRIIESTLPEEYQNLNKIG